MRCRISRFDDQGTDEGGRQMHFKLIIVMVEDDKTEAVLDAAREAGATGATVLNQARGEGIQPQKTFLGLNLEARRDVLLLLVEEHRSRRILERIAEVGGFDSSPGTGIALQIDVEDAVGVRHQMRSLSKQVEEEL
jgi:nitrogen regulatory protein PII